MGRMLLHQKEEIKNSLKLHKEIVKLNQHFEDTETRYEMQRSKMIDKHDNELDEYDSTIYALVLKIAQLCGDAIGEPLQTECASESMRELPLEKLDEMTNEWFQKYENFKNNEKKQQEDE